MIALAAFMLSLATVLTSAWLAWRGSVVIAVPPESVFFYRDGKPGAAVLTVGVDTALVNAASSNFGDVVTKIEVEVVGEPSSTFGYRMLVTPAFRGPEDGSETCPERARCVHQGRFTAIEEPRRTLDVPGGASRSEYIGFNLFEAYCSKGSDCAGFGEFDQVVARLESQPVLELRFRYRLHRDGDKVVSCRIPVWNDASEGEKKWLGRQLSEYGWASARCE